MRSPRAATVWVLVLLVIFGLAPSSGAADDTAPTLGDGWSIAAGTAGPVLVYTLDEALPLRDARPEFRVGNTLLGFPVERDDRLELALTPAALAALESPSVWLSGRRLDGPTPVEAITQAEPIVSLPARILSGRDDPGGRGPYPTEMLSYQLPDLPVGGYEAPLEVLAEVIAPLGAPGPRPLVLFLHGRHDFCYSPTPPLRRQEAQWPCPEGTLPVPSHQGYRYVAGLLASQGYITVSISANAINAQDGWQADNGTGARSALIRHHLAQWVAWNNLGGDPWGGRFQGAVDLNQVVLVGHSRGGEGIERAAVDATPADGYTIVGLVPIAPTSFGRQTSAGVTTAVILPYCDGDVVDLQGQAYIDDGRDLTRDRALHSAVLVLGANHNFFNTEWTPGLAVAPSFDDWFGPADDPVCGTAGRARLTSAEQQAVGATYIAALVHVAVDRDPTTALLLDGSSMAAASAGRAQVLVHALGGRRRLVYRPRLADMISTWGLSARVCRGHLYLGSSPLGGSLTSDCDHGASFERLPHWLPMMGAGTAPSPLALDLQWWRSGGTTRIDLQKPKNLTRAQDLDLRLAVDSASSPVRFALRLIDQDGNIAELPAGQPVQALRGKQAPLGKIWAQTLRFSLTGAGGIDLGAVVGFELVTKTERGRAWLLDIHARHPGLPHTTPIDLPQVSIADTSVPEGGPAQHTVTLPLTIQGEVARPAVLWVGLAGREGSEQGFRIVLPPGTTAADIPITVTGDDVLDRWPIQYTVTLKALSEVTTGGYTAILTLTDDEPAPTLTFEATTGRVAEGGILVFTATLSAPVPFDLWYNLNLGEVAGKPTLYTDDVDQDWLMLQTGSIPNPPQPLWQILWPTFIIPPGTTSASFEIPTVADDIVEGREYITATLQGWDDLLLPVPITLTGIVHDA